MTKRPLWICTLLLVGSLQAQDKPKADKQDLPTFPTEVELVTVDVVIVDKQGVPIRGLAQSDFIITENDKPQTISSFEAVDVPPASGAAAAVPAPVIVSNVDARARVARSFVVVFDDLHLSPLRTQAARKALEDFLKTAVGEGDRVLLVATSGKAWWSARLEGGREGLLTVLKGLKGQNLADHSREWVSDVEAQRIVEYHDSYVCERILRRFIAAGVLSGYETCERNTFPAFIEARAYEVHNNAGERARATLELLKRVISSLTLAQGRKSVVLVSDGFAYDGSRTEFRDVTRVARTANAAIYFLDTQGIASMPWMMSAESATAVDSRDIGAMFSDAREATSGAEAVASESGGFTVRNTNDLTAGIRRIAAESQSYYMLGYYPADTRRDGKFRRIKVEASRKDVIVRARKGYNAPTEDDGLGDGERAKSPTIQEALDSPFDQQGIPLRATVVQGSEAAAGKAQASIVLDVDVSRLDFRAKKDRLTNALDVFVTVVSQKTLAAQSSNQTITMNLLPETRELYRTRPYSVSRAFDLEPGVYQAKAIVRDLNGNRMGSLTLEFEVPKPEGFRLSSLIISDTLNAARDSALPVAHRTFKTTDFVVCQYEVLGATPDPETHEPRVTADFTLRPRAGAGERGMPPTPIQVRDKRLVRLAGMALADFPPGDYDISVQLKDEVSGQTLSIVEPFAVSN